MKMTSANVMFLAAVVYRQAKSNGRKVESRFGHSMLPGLAAVSW